MLDHDWIAAHIPHAGTMCLLDTIVDWSDEHISCIATSHTAATNPLRAEDRLGAAAGIEYAAQAMAAHGALRAEAGEVPRPGLLTSLRGVHLHRARLDDLPGELAVFAERLSGDRSSVLYHFVVSHDAERLVEGRATVVLDAATVDRERRA